MNAGQADDWKETRTKGLWKFVWRVGVGRWGVFMCVFFVVQQGIETPDRLLFILLRNIPIWLCAGVIFGFLVWYGNEWAYKRFMARQINLS